MYQRRAEVEEGKQIGVRSKLVRIGEVSVAAGANHFTKLVIKDNQGYRTLWEGGEEYDLEVEEGVSWELRCCYTGYNAGAMWNMSVTMVAMDLPRSDLRKQCFGDRYEGTSVPEKCKDFPMGVMPNEDIMIDRVKLWSTDYYTTQKPPSDQW